MDKLSKKDVLPKTLFISDVKADPTSSIGHGGFGSVFKGEHDGRPVALKVLYKARNNEVGAFHLCLSDADLFARTQIRSEKIFVERPSLGGHSHTSLSCLS